MSDGLQIPEHLWKALELMEEEMGVPKSNLVCQAIFTLARLNGYVVAGQVSLSPAAPAPSAPVGRAAAPETATPLGREKVENTVPRASPSPPPRTSVPRASTPSAPRVEMPPLSYEEPLDTPPAVQDTSPRYVAPPAREHTERRRSSPVIPPPPPLPPYPEALAMEEHLPPEEELAHEEEEEHNALYTEAELAAPTLYIEIPGEDPVAMEGEECIIGRGKSCNFVIDSNRVSRQHARIIRDGDDFVLEDLNSSNGTFFGKHREKVTRRIIANGEEFIFGTERLTFHIE